ncbi:glycosyltransferase [Homoserinimonas sp. A520]
MLDAVTLLERAPDGIRRLAHRIATGQGALGRLADVARYRFSEDEVPVPQLPRDAHIRLVIGPANSAEQGYQWSRAFERSFPSVAAMAMHGIGVGPFLPQADIKVPMAVYQRSVSWLDSFEQYLSHQTHLIWESGLPLLGRRYGSDVKQEMTQFGARGVKGALLFHGSDIRPPSRHAALNEWSPFRDASGPVRALEEGAARNAALAAESGLPVFVSTPDLLRWLPEATWCPVVVDTTKWREAAATRSSAGPLVVAHAPSHKWLKGTDRVEPMLHRLSEEGVIEYRQAFGVPHASMPGFYAEADIVLDQFALGIYGVAACEAMASGRLVMSHVDDFTRDRVRERTGLELPIHEVTIGSLEDELRRAAAEPEHFEAMRAAGPAFVEAVHGGRRSAAAIAPFLGLSA